MARDDTTDILAAFLIGAALGLGATLLLRDDDDREIARIMRALHRRGRRSPVQRIAGVARGTGDDLVAMGRRVASTLRDEATEIVASARDELLDLAKDGAKQARKVRDRI